MKCPKCGSSNLDFMVDVCMVLPIEYDHRINKKAVWDKRTEFWGASWNRAAYFCKEEKCGWSLPSPDPKWLKELTTLQNKNEDEEGTPV